MSNRIVIRLGKSAYDPPDSRPRLPSALPVYAIHSLAATVAHATPRHSLTRELLAVVSTNARMVTITYRGISKQLARDRSFQSYDSTNALHRTPNQHATPAIVLDHRIDTGLTLGSIELNAPRSMTLTSVHVLLDVKPAAEFRATARASLHRVRMPCESGLKTHRTNTEPGSDKVQPRPALKSTKR